MLIIRWLDPQGCIIIDVFLCETYALARFGQLFCVSKIDRQDQTAPVSLDNSCCLVNIGLVTSLSHRFQS